MEELKKRIHDDSNGLDYVLVGDYYIPDLKLPGGGAGCTKYICKNTDPASTTNCFCRENSGRILPI